MKKIIALILVMLLCMSSAFAADIYSNTAAEACSGNLDNAGFPAFTTAFEYGQTVYFNVAVSSDVYLKTCKFWVDNNLIDNYRANNYYRWHYTDMTLSPGVHNISVEISDTDGNVYGKDWQITVSDNTSYDSGAAAASTQYESDYDRKVQAFMADYRFAPGSDWGYNQTCKSCSWTAKGCCAFAADYCCEIFGDWNWSGGTKYTNLSEAKTGDIIYCQSSNGIEHWICVLYRNGNSLTTLEGNMGGKVVYAEGDYTIDGGNLYRKGNRWTFYRGYHYL